MKKILTTLAIFAITGTCSFAQNEQYLDILPVLSANSSQQNRLWVGTFQLVWNDLMEEVVKGPVKFQGETPLIVKQLNRKTFTVEDLNSSSYYKTLGKTSPELKQKIETAIKEKFNETSDILDEMDWTAGPNKYTIYAMLKKDFKFLTAFDKLKPERFGRSTQKFEYFGINKDSDKILDSTVNVLFYNSNKDFAVSVNTQCDDVLYLYRTNNNKTFNKLYIDMIAKESRYQGTNEFLKDDELKVPNIKLFNKKVFDELCNKQIKGTDFLIDQAIETIDFVMNNEGVKLKSEAAIATRMSFMPGLKKQKARKFYFNDTFVIFLQEAGKTEPYFALRVKDLSTVNKSVK